MILFKTASESDGVEGGKPGGIHSLLTRLIQKESLLLPLVSCFRHASTDVDSDIIYWSCVIIHEFATNEIEVLLRSEEESAYKGVLVLAPFDRAAGSR